MPIVSQTVLRCTFEALLCFWSIQVFPGGFWKTCCLKFYLFLSCQSTKKLLKFMGLPRQFWDSQICRRIPRKGKPFEIPYFSLSFWIVEAWMICSNVYHFHGLLQGVNFTNILCAAFLYESFTSSFFVLEVKVKLFIGAKKMVQMCSKNVDEIDSRLYQVWNRIHCSKCNHKWHVATWIFSLS